MFFYRIHLDIIFLSIDSLEDSLQAHITEAEVVLRILDLHGKMPFIIRDGRFDDTSMGTNLADGGTHQRAHIVAHGTTDFVAGFHGILFLRIFICSSLAYRYRTLHLRALDVGSHNTP